MMMMHTSASIFVHHLYLYCIYYYYSYYYSYYYYRYQLLDCLENLPWLRELDEVKQLADEMAEQNHLMM